MAQKKLFLIGPGFIGGSLLVRLREARPDLALSALTRRADQAAELAALGIEAVHGSLQDGDVIQQHASQADIIIHAATADDKASALAVVEGIKRRADMSRKVVYIHTSGNDELLDSARGMKTASVEDKTLSDAEGDAALEERIQADAPHRQVDGPLRALLVNEEQEKAYNASTAIMVPPLIYGVGSKPWERISIQAPMLARAMMDKGAVKLPSGNTTRWNAVWVHDLVEAYLVLLADLEGRTPGTRPPSHYAFPSEPSPFLWSDLLAAIVGELKAAGHASAQTEPRELDEAAFYDFIGGNDNPYALFFKALVFGQENSYTRPE